MAFFTWTEVAWAQVPDDVAAVDQYRETIPTGAGRTGVGTGSDGDGAASLPPGARAALNREAGDLAPLLDAIATSGGFGAPTGSLEASGRGVRPDDDGGSVEPSAAEAAAGAVTGDGANRVVGLLIALLAISALVVGGAVLRQRV